jgi:serralysin
VSHSPFSGTGALRLFDEIHDFRQSDLDIIDLSAIDANPDAPGDQPFLWVLESGSDFIGLGRIRVQHFTGGVDLLGETTGDGVADLKIRVHGDWDPDSVIM